MDFIFMDITSPGIGRQMGREYAVQTLPTVIIVGSDDRIVMARVGFTNETDYRDALTRGIEEALEE